MEIKISTNGSVNIKRGVMVCQLIKQRLNIIFGLNTAKKINVISFDENIQGIRFIVKDIGNKYYDIVLAFNLLKNALQIGEGQKILDETLLSVKNQII